MSKSFDVALDEWKEQIDCELENIIAQTKYPPEFKDVLGYALFPGGKRLRPILFLAWHGLFADIDEHALRYACAIELLHSYSLIHDDMPCMDNDEYRRGKLTVHKKYGEGMALLAGDALMDLAYAVLNIPAPRCEKAPLMFAHSQVNDYLPLSPFGDAGLICGQYYDLFGKFDDLDSLLQKVHALKTGALISFACTSGASLGLSLRYKADSELMYSVGDDCAPIIDGNDGECEGIVAAIDFGKAFGVAFQLYDDISEYIAGEKTSGTSVLNFIDLEKAKNMLNTDLNDAARALDKVRVGNTEFLREFLDKFIIA